jgi:hypothetical protein
MGRILIIDDGRLNAEILRGCMRFWLPQSYLTFYGKLPVRFGK